MINSLSLLLSATLIHGTTVAIASNPNSNPYNTEVIKSSYVTSLVDVIMKHGGLTTPGVETALLEDLVPSTYPEDPKLSQGAKSGYFRSLRTLLLDLKDLYEPRSKCYFSFHLNSSTIGTKVAKKILSLTKEMDSSSFSLNKLLYSFPAFMLPFEQVGFDFDKGDISGMLLMSLNNFEEEMTRIPNNCYKQDLKDFLATVLDGAPSHYAHLFDDEIVSFAQELRAKVDGSN